MTVYWVQTKEWSGTRDRSETVSEIRIGIRARTRTGVIVEKGVRRRNGVRVGIGVRLRTRVRLVMLHHQSHLHPSHAPSSVALLS